MIRRATGPLLLAFIAGSGLVLPSAIPAATSLTRSVESEASAKKSEKETKKERKARLNPQISPPPNWPPKGFTASNGIYAKIPTKRELAGLVSARTSLFEAIQPCDQFACGSVIVASAEKCLWWEVLSTVVGPKTSDTSTITSYGSLTTKTSGSEARSQKVADRRSSSSSKYQCHLSSLWQEGKVRQHLSSL
jgi:hypothetical protein